MEPDRKPAERAHRPIRTYVIRGKITRAQLRAYQQLYPVYGLPFAREKLDFEKVFGRKAPVILEIGFGMGDATMEIAAQHPQMDYLAVEVYKPGVGSLLRKIQNKQLTNVRIIHHDAIEVLEHMIENGSLAGVHIFFPDPWPKKRHHKRRIIQPRFIQLVTDKLSPGGYIHICTDWQDYAEHILSVLQQEPRLQNSARGFAPRPAWRPLTKYEQHGLRKDHPVREVHFVRTG